MVLYAKWSSLGDEALTVAFSTDPSDGQIISCDGHGKESYCVYTGEKITPAVVVAFGENVLKEGRDYTLKYSDNTKVTKKKKASVKITLAGDFSGEYKLEFAIREKRLDDGNGEPASDIEMGQIVAERGKAAAAPEIIYGDYVLTSKDFEMSPGKPVAGTVSSVSIKGKGNFTGEIKNVPVIARSKDEMKDYRIFAAVKIAKNKTKVYNGEKQELGSDELIVTVQKSGYKPEPGRDYTVTYKNNINAGTAKVIINGTGSCYGRVTKTFKISPDKNVSIKEITLADGDKPVYCAPDPAEPKLSVKKEDGRELTEGKDYKVKYINNKKPGDHAKYKISFIGNYKGRKVENGEFKITPAPFDSAVISAGSIVYLKPGKLQPSLDVFCDGVLLANKKDYTFRLYYGEDDVTTKKLTLEEKDLPATITVRVTGKGRFRDDTAEGSFLVYDLPDNAYDLTSAKIVDKKTGKTLAKQNYTGKEIRPSVTVLAKTKGGSEYKAVPSENLIITYYDNVQRGKAKIEVRGDNVKAFGSKKTGFTIKVRSIRDIIPHIFSIK